MVAPAAGTAEPAAMVAEAKWEVGWAPAVTVACAEGEARVVPSGPERLAAGSMVAAAKADRAGAVAGGEAQAARAAREALRAVPLEVEVARAVTAASEAAVAQAAAMAPAGSGLAAVEAGLVVGPGRPADLARVEGSGVVEGEEGMEPMGRRSGHSESEVAVEKVPAKAEAAEAVETAVVAVVEWARSLVEREASRAAAAALAVAKAAVAKAAALAVAMVAARLAEAPAVATAEGN